MYIQGRFREDRLAHLHAFIRAHALATVVVTTPEPEAFLMPLELVASESNGVLRGHAARTNHFSTVPSGSRVLVIFQSANAYISPRWYVTGQDSGRVAPSWNYATVHATGSLHFIDDAAWVRRHLESHTSAHESSRANPWSLREAPPDFIDGLVKRLVGIEIPIDRIEGKQFLSQQLSTADRASLARHLRAEPRGTAHDVAAMMDELIAIDQHR